MILNWNPATQCLALDLESTDRRNGWIKSSSASAWYPCAWQENMDPASFITNTVDSSFGSDLKIMSSQTIRLCGRDNPGNFNITKTANIHCSLQNHFLLQHWTTGWCSAYVWFLCNDTFLQHYQCLHVKFYYSDLISDNLLICIQPVRSSGTFACVLSSEQ